MPVSDQEFIVAPTLSPLTISLEPAQNVVHSLMLLAKSDAVSGFGDWVVRTVAALTPEERHDHELVMIGLHNAVQPTRRWSSFPVYLEHLASVTPVTLRDKILDGYAAIPPLQEGCYDWSAEPVPVDKNAVLADVDAFLAFLRERFTAEHIDEALETQAFAYLNDPPAMQTLIVSHLRHMWDAYLAAEWERVRPMLEDAVEAFRQLDFSEMSKFEAAQTITGQKLDGAHWERSLAEAEQVIFVPSAHVGPYLGRFRVDNGLGIIFGARLPAGAEFHAPDLSRAEIVVRLGALADDIRLGILRLIADEGELRSQEIMDRLDLSQSAASRHLKQLSATGYLRERRCNGAKCYRIDPERVEDTLRAVSAFLLG